MWKLRIHYVFIFFIFIGFQNVSAQSGCTDPQALNYDSKAKTNDGSCFYPVTDGKTTYKGTFGPNITESSGITYSDGKLWTHDDSGNSNDFFQIDSSDGHTLQTVYIDNYSNIDWEDITADSGYIYIGDCGNNSGGRTNLRILKIKKSDIGSTFKAHLTAQSIEFSYSDQIDFSGKINNYDCEAIVAIDTSIYLFTKDHLDFKTRVYKLSKKPGAYSISPITSYDVNGMITGADYDPVRREIVLIGYLKGATNSFLYLLSDFEKDSFFSGNKRRIELGDNTLWQTEGVAFVDSSKLFISCEKAGAFTSSLFKVDAPWLSKRSAIDKSDKNITFKYYPNPAQGRVFFQSGEIIKNLTIEDLTGRTIYTQPCNGNSFYLDLNSFEYNSGFHIIKLFSTYGMTSVKIYLYH